MSEILIRPMRVDEAPARDELLFLSYREYAVGGNHPELGRRELFGRLQRSDPRMRPEYSYLLFCDGVLAAQLTVFLWPVRIAGRVVTAGLIADVATLPAYRRRGYVRMLLEAARGFLRETGIPLSWLYGADRVYASSGYVSWRGHVTLAADGFGPPPAGMTVRPIDPGQDLAALHGLYEHWNRDQTGPILRSEEDWAGRILAPDAQDLWGGYRAIETAGRVLAYAHLAGDVAGTVTEYGALDDEVASDTLRALAAICGRGALTFGFAGKRLRQALASAALRVEVRTGGTHGMWLVLDGRSLGLPEPVGIPELFAVLEREEYVYYELDTF
jgi:predicted N-acetyltransferase YhbS